MAQRILSSSVNWSLLGESVPKHMEAAAFQAFKAKSDKYLKRLGENPAESPKINWDLYKSKIMKPGFVEELQKSYESLKIPYPGDQGFLAKVEDDFKNNKKVYADYVSSVRKRVEELKVMLKKLEQEIPYSEMTQEEYVMANPEVLDALYKPKFTNEFDKKEGSQSH